jgi:adenylate cyclase
MPHLTGTAAIVAQGRLGRRFRRYDPTASVGRFLRYWYTYRTFVAVLLGIAVSGSMFWLYTQQVIGDAGGQTGLNISVHPEDRLMAGGGGPFPTDPNIEIVGIDNESVAKLGSFPIHRDLYAQALANLEKAGAAVVAFDIGFPDPGINDKPFEDALRNATVPVVLGYGGSNTQPADGKFVQGDLADQIPLKQFWCADASTSKNTPCQQPYKNVLLASTDIRPDPDGVLRRIPMFVQPDCYANHSCDIAALNPLSFAAYRAYVLQSDFATGPTLQESGGEATFGTAWPQPMPVDSSGAAIINYFGPPENYKLHHQYVSFGDVQSGNFSGDAVKGKIVLVGDYFLTGVNDQILATTSAGAGGAQMAGVEMHANVLQMLLGAPPPFLAHEPPLVVFLILLLSGLLMAFLVARLSVAWGLLATVFTLVVFTVVVAAIAANGNLVPDLFHPWMTIGLVYSGVTAYRFLYEDREKRKVTSLFGQYLKPEIVAKLAQHRGGVEDIMRGGERRDLTLLFVDVRGFTSMSESMAAEDVTTLIQMYLDHLSGIIFTWDGTIDKYVGDEIVAFWNAPRDQPDHALLAVRCAYDLINRAPELEKQLLEKGLPPIRWGIGVNTGHAVVGNMGSRSRLQYTALGDTVNTAARFCANAPAFHLLIGQPTYDQCRDYIAVDMVPGVQLKGKSAETFRIYQVTAIRETTSSPWVQFPTEMAAQAHHEFTQQFTQKTILAASNLGSRDLLVGTEAEQALAGQATGPDGHDGTGE